MDDERPDLPESTAADDRPAKPPADGATGPGTIPDRYAALGLLQEGVVIYDRENSDAWIQSDRTLEPQH